MYIIEAYDDCNDHNGAHRPLSRLSRHWGLSRLQSQSSDVEHGDDYCNGRDGCVPRFVSPQVYLKEYPGNEFNRN